MRRRSGRQRPAGATSTQGTGSHCPGPRRRRRDKGRRGQPPTSSGSHCPGSRRRRGRQRPAGATSHKLGEPLPGVEKTEKTTKAGGVHSHCPGKQASDEARWGQNLTSAGSHRPRLRRRKRVMKASRGKLPQA